VCRTQDCSRVWRVGVRVGVVECQHNRSSSTVFHATHITSHSTQPPYPAVLDGWGKVRTKCGNARKNIKRKNQKHGYKVHTKHTHLLYILIGIKLYSKAFISHFDFVVVMNIDCTLPSCRNITRFYNIRLQLCVAFLV